MVLLFLVFFFLSLPENVSDAFGRFFIDPLLGRLGFSFQPSSESAERRLARLLPRLPSVQRRFALAQRRREHSVVGEGNRGKRQARRRSAPSDEG